MEKPKSSNALNTIAKGAGVVAATGLAAAAGWAAYSALFINHRRTLPPAIDAKRYVTATPLGGRLSFYADESASGRPLVLVHSVNAAASAYEMRPIFEHYRGKRPVFAVELPGFGFSERADRLYSPDLFIQAILDFVDGELAGEGPIDIVALSLSCEFCTFAALEQPDFFSSLVMLAPTGFTADAPRPQLAAGTVQAERMYRAASFPVWAQAFYDLIVTRPSLRYFLQKTFHGPVDKGLEEYGYLAAHRPGARYVPLHFISGKLFTAEIREYYAMLQQPVLAFCDMSGYGPSDLLPDFAAAHPNWTVREIEGSRAMPHFERPDATFAAMDAFYAAQAEKIAV
jgi:pimeloyl-ACP methyl ester carboxylesterase